MANYATNIFYASTENEKDLDKVENFLEDTFCDCYLDRSDRGRVFVKMGLSRKRDKQDDFSFGGQRQNLHSSADTRTM